MPPLLNIEGRDSNPHPSTHKVQVIEGPFARVITHRVAATLNDTATSQFMLEMDSHADSPVVGNQAHILEYTGRKVSVSGFTDALGKPMLVEVVHA